jgi:hypothetical protein
VRELLHADTKLVPGVRLRLEREVRREAVIWSRSAPGHTLEEKASRIHLAPRTLRAWVAGWRDERLYPRPRGRPVDAASPDDVARMLGLLWVLGPSTGWATLAPYFPEVSRRELRSLLARSRRLWTRLSRRGCLSLRWAEPGTVWATDFTEPPAPIEGRYEKILLVRDLASGMTLLSLSCEGEDGLTVAAALKSLFLEHGAPLVLKYDNVSPFCCEEVAGLLARERVIGLPSPPRYPQYNGACEAGGGSIKTRAHHLSARAGRPGRWTLDDVEGARVLGNEIGRPEGHPGPTPVERWTTRRRIDPWERRLLAQTVARELDSEAVRRATATPPCPLTASAATPRRRPDDVELASRWRAAVARALVERGLLQFRTRRVSPPISAFLAAVFS